MAAPMEDATHEEKRAVVRFLAAEGVKPSQVYRRMSAQYGSYCWIFPKPFQFQNEICPQQTQGHSRCPTAQISPLKGEEGGGGGGVYLLLVLFMTP